MRVLIIEDDDAIREIARMCLEKVARWEVGVAADGPTGVAQAERHRPDLILLDVMMPEVDGPATLALLRARPATQDIPVIFLTAKLQASERRRLVALGTLGVIGKPFDPLRLPDEIRRLMPGAIAEAVP